MMYYVNNNKLISSNIPIGDTLFVEITKENYELRLRIAEENREQGEKVDIDYESEVELW